MTSRGKKIFLACSIIVPFLIYSLVYYMPIIRNAPFKAKDFVSFEYKWGVGKQLANSYNSATGEYRYVNEADSLFIKKVILNTKDFKYLDSNADEQGFWNLPNIVANNQADVNNPNILRYYMKFNYQKKTKKVTFLANFDGNVRMKKAASAMQKIIEQLINDAEERKN